MSSTKRHPYLTKEFWEKESSKFWLNNQLYNHEKYEEQHKRILDTFKYNKIDHIKVSK